jgi:hypothetical protein
MHGSCSTTIIVSITNSKMDGLKKEEGKKGTSGVNGTQPKDLE